MAQSEKNPAAKTRAEDRCFEENWHAAHRVLRRRALRLTRGDRNRADDLLSVTAIKSLKILRRIPERIREPRGFLFLVLRHAHLDNVRREEREKRIFGEDILWRTKEENEDEEEENEVVDEARTPFETLLAVERLENVFRVLGYLTPSQRQLFELIFLGGHSYPEIAEILDISAALARKRVQLLREKLRRLTKSSQD